MDSRKFKHFRTALVTGGAGFIGSHLVDRLANEGIKVYVLDNLSSGRKENVSNRNVKIICGDIRNTRLVDILVKKSDIVFHLAEYIPETQSYGIGHVIKYSVENPLLDFDVSCYGSLIVLDKCRKYDKKIIFTSSAAVYGKNNAVPISETSATMPSSPYGASKLCAETYMLLYSRLYKLPTTILRLSNVYGPRQRKYIIYDILLKLMKNPNKLEVLGTGLEERDFIFVDDVVYAFLLIADNPETNGIVYNVGTGVSTSIEKLVKLILQITNLKPEVSYTQISWKGNIEKITLNVERIKKLGFRNAYSLEDGLTETVNWFKSTHNTCW